MGYLHKSLNQSLSQDILHSLSFQGLRAGVSHGVKNSNPTGMKGMFFCRGRKITMFKDSLLAFSHSLTLRSSRLTSVSSSRNFCLRLDTYTSSRGVFIVLDTLL